MYIRRANKCRCVETKKFRHMNPREKLGVGRGAGSRTRKGRQVWKLEGFAFCSQ